MQPPDVHEVTARILASPLDQLPSLLETFAWRYDKVRSHLLLRDGNFVAAGEEVCLAVAAKRHELLGSGSQGRWAAAGPCTLPFMCFREGVGCLLHISLCFMY